MKNKMIITISATFLFILMQSFNSFAQTMPVCPKQIPPGMACIIVKPRNYVGNYYINSAEAKHNGDYPILAKIGDNYIGIGGWGYPEATINFKVTRKGSIDGNSISNPSAVSSNGNILSFNNVQIFIRPQNFSDVYFLAGHPQQTGNHTFDVVPNVLSLVEFYGTGINNEILFKIGTDGTISNVSNPAAAFACNKTLTFNNVKIYSDPTTYTGNYRLGGNYGVTEIKELIAVPNVLLPVTIGNDSAFVTPFISHVAPTSVNLSTYQIRFSVSPEILGLRSWWRAEDNANDVLGIYNGTITNTTYDYGLVGKAFKFDNPVNPVSFISVNSQAFLKNSGTLSMWFKWNGNGETVVAAQVLIGSCANPRCDNRTPFIKISQGKLNWEFGNWGIGNPSSQNSIETNKWYHTALSYSKNDNQTYSIKFYLNGVKIHEKSDTPADNPINFNDTFGIGKGINVPAHGFNGLIDEVTIYNHAIRENEILKIYQAGIGI